MKTTLRNIFLGVKPEVNPASGISVRGVRAATAGTAVRSPCEDLQLESKAVEQFLTELKGGNLRVLDLTKACQDNLDTISNCGHTPVPDDFLYMLDECFGEPGDFFENQGNPERQDRFMQHCLQYDDWTFDGALVWDSLEYLTPELLVMTLDHLFGLLKPGSQLLATFHTEANDGMVPAYTYQMQGGRKLRLTGRGERMVARGVGSIADIEMLFARYSSVKFFVPREGLREVIVRR